jgi:hypothetical protein
MLKVVTVLRSGGDFRPGHVARLHEQWQTWSPIESAFYCLTDMELPGYIRTLPLLNNWPGWWSKIEAFKLPGPVLYLDLDTLITGDLEPICHQVRVRDFLALREFNGVEGLMGSGLMGWSGDASHVYRSFAKDPQRYMRECRTSRKWGDQGFIGDAIPHGLRTYWQDVLPGAVVSWKRHCRGGVIPPAARIVCFHGKPRPWEIGL